MAKSLALLAIIAAAVSALDLRSSPPPMELQPDDAPIGSQADEGGCPYIKSADKKDFQKAGEDSYHCHFGLPLEENGGRSCPVLQKERFEIANTFYEKNYEKFMAAAEEMTLTPTYDKLKFLKTPVPESGMARQTATILVDDTFELLDKYHIDILSQESPEAMAMMKNVEDKILLKLFADKVSIKCTDEYYHAQISEYNRGEFRKALNEMCADPAVTGFLLKPTFLSWSAMLYQMFDWQKQCRGDKDKKITEVLKHAEKALCTTNRPTDGHLNLLTPGFTVESLFRTGGKSEMPLEVKLLMLFGKPYVAFFIGTDQRGCDHGPGATNIYGDGTGWDFTGARFDYGGGEAQVDSKDTEMHRFMTDVWPRLVKEAEIFAQAVGGDYLRFDAFVGDMDAVDPNDIKLELNEVENVSGAKYIYERFGLGSIWRDGYLRRKRKTSWFQKPTMQEWAGNPMKDGNAETWNALWKQLQEDRDAHNLDSTPPPEGEPRLDKQCYANLKETQNNLDKMDEEGLFAASGLSLIQPLSPRNEWFQGSG